MSEIPVTVIASIKVKAGSEERALALLSSIVPPTREEPDASPTTCTSRLLIRLNSCSMNAGRATPHWRRTPRPPRLIASPCANNWVRWLPVRRA